MGLFRCVSLCVGDLDAVLTPTQDFYVDAELDRLHTELDRLSTATHADDPRTPIVRRSNIPVGLDRHEEEVEVLEDRIQAALIQPVGSTVSQKPLQRRRQS